MGKSEKAVPVIHYNERVIISKSSKKSPLSKMTKAGSVNFSRRGGLCCTGNCFSLSHGGDLDFNTEFYTVSDDTVVFSEDPGPGWRIACFSMLLPPVCIVLGLLSTCKTVNGLIFTVDSATNSVTGSIYRKFACSEDDVVVLKDVLDVKVKCTREPVANGPPSAVDFIVSFLISYVGADNTIQVYTTKGFTRSERLFRKQYYEEFEDEVNMLIEKHKPAVTPDRNVAAQKSSRLSKGPVRPRTEEERGVEMTESGPTAQSMQREGQEIVATEASEADNVIL